MPVISGAFGRLWQRIMSLGHLGNKARHYLKKGVLERWLVGKNTYCSSRGLMRGSQSPVRQLTVVHDFSVVESDTSALQGHLYLHTETFIQIYAPIYSLK